MMRRTGIEARKEYELVPLIDSMVMDEDRFYLDGAKKALVWYGTIVAIENDKSFFRGDIAGRG